MKIGEHQYGIGSGHGCSKGLVAILTVAHKGTWGQGYLGNRAFPKVGPGTGGVGPPSFGINYGSISFGQLSGYIVFCILRIGGASPPI